MAQVEDLLSAPTKKLQKQLTYTLIVTVYCIKNIGATTLLHFSAEPFLLDMTIMYDK